MFMNVGCRAIIFFTLVSYFAIESAWKENFFIVNVICLVFADPVLID